MFKFLDRPIPTWSEVKENWNKKHHPVQYMTQTYVKSIEQDPNQPDWTQVSNTLVKLATAEKNYTANDSKPKFILKAISILGSAFSIACITQPEKFDTFVSKAWPFVYKDRDQD